jgi:hypothetical protein
MEKQIFKYLDKKYKIDTSKVGNYGIYENHDVPELFRTPYNGSKLISEIAIVFGVNNEDSKDLINIWSLNLNKLVNLDFYWDFNSGPIWDEREQTFFPVAGRVAASTIALDLIPVRPLETPRGDLFLIDYTYVGGVDLASDDNDTIVISRFPVNYDASSKNFIETQMIENRNRKWNASGLLEGLTSSVNLSLNNLYCCSSTHLKDNKEESLSDDEDIYL